VTCAKFSTPTPPFSDQWITFLQPEPALDSADTKPQGQRLLQAKSKDQSPWKPNNRCSACQYITLFLWNTKVHCRVNNSPPPVSILSQRSPIYNLHNLGLRSTLISSSIKSSPSARHGGAWGERRYSSYSFSTSALDGGEWSASRPDRALPPGKGPPVPIVQEVGWAPEPVWTQRLEEKSSAPAYVFRVVSSLRVLKPELFT
jgi:hypothetical protein